MGNGGIVFGDGIESDGFEFPDGTSITLRVAHAQLNLVV